MTAQSATTELPTYLLWTGQLVRSVRFTTFEQCILAMFRLVECCFAVLIKQHDTLLCSGQTADMNNYGPDYLMSDTYPDRSIFNWTVSVPMMYIEQVPHTYAYTLGLYGIQNEHQLSIGESTTGSKLMATPLSEGGNAAMKMETLTELALERCMTARCAVQLIGDMGTKYGFYGGDGNPEEAGEALTIADPTELWVFHILPDDTGSSAVWAAQRVPDDHITVLANSFIIQEIDLSKPVRRLL
jgi:hypothetical protein